MLDYMTLKLIWWVLVCVLLLGFAIMDGHDMGVGALLPFVGRSDSERRVLLNTVGPHWDGNQVWFITAGGAIFAAWPLVYATAFSGFYFALLAVLWALFLRPVGFDYRSKLADPRWRSSWDWGLFIGGAVPSLVFGVAIGNVIQGVPFHYDEIMLAHYTGHFWALFNPFALLCGVVSLCMLVAHGAYFLVLRTEGVIRARARRAALILTPLMLAAFALGGVWVAGMEGYRITSVFDPGAVLTPTGKTVVREAGAWLATYRHYPLTLGLPLAAFVGGAASVFATLRQRPLTAFVASGVTELGVLFTAAASIFPFVLPSSSQPSHSLTVWDCVSSQRTLGIMFWVALIMTPIVIAYTSWAYRVMRGTVTEDFIKANSRSSY